MITTATTPGSNINLGRKYFDAVEGTSIAYRVCGAIRLTGIDRADFLERMSTQESAGRSQGSVFRNILTNEKGRIVDVVWQIHNDDSLLLLSGHSSGVPTMEWLNRYIFSEDIQVQDVTPLTSQLVVLGNQSPSFLGEVLGFEQLPSQGMSLRKEFGQSQITCFRDGYFQIPAYILLCESHAPMERSPLPSVIDETQIHHLDPGFLEIFRIESGIPAIGREIDSSVNPLEANLGDSVNFSKGCYIGQEVIARIETYHKLQKRLVGFSFSQSTAHVLQPGNVVENGASVGRTTSHCYSHRLNRQIALGYLSMRSSGTNLQLVNAEGCVDANVHQLPFEV